MTKRAVLSYLEFLMDEGFYGEIVLPMQNGKVETIKKRESLKDEDIQKTIRDKKE